MTSPINTTTGYRFEEVAAFVADLAARGILRPGSRAPSLRKICSTRGVSLSTALRAYELLEDRGILQARPRSGYYVAPHTFDALRAPAISSPPVGPTDIAISATVLKLLEHASDTRLAPLGCAIPSPELLAAGRLDRFMSRAARTRGPSHNVYSEPKGDLRLREEIARRALAFGWGISPDQIVITNGGTEALAIALKTVAKPRQVIAVESPTYFGILHLLESQGLRALELPTDPVEGISVEALANAIRGQGVAACLLASSFNNPLGCTMPESKKLEILRLLGASKVPLIEDDVYGEIYFTPTRPKPFSALDSEADVMHCGSFSKTIAPGYRIGWLATRKYLASALEQKLSSTLASPTLAQAALADFLGSGGYDGHLRRIRRTFADNIDRMIRTIAASFPEGTRVSRPAGGFVLWVELPSQIDARMLLDQAIAQGICFAPGDVFSARRNFSHCLRLSCGHPWNGDIEASVRTVGELASMQAGKKAA